MRINFNTDFCVVLPGTGAYNPASLVTVYILMAALLSEDTAS